MELKMLERYTKGISKRLFEVLDRTKVAMESNDDNQLLEIQKFMETLAIEIKGSLYDYEQFERGIHLNSVANILLELKSITDYNVRRKKIKDCLSTVHRVTEDVRAKIEVGGEDS